MSTTSIVNILYGTNRYFLKLCISKTLKTLIKNNSLLLRPNHYDQQFINILLRSLYKGYKNQCDETMFSASNASRQVNEILLFLCTQT